MACDRSDKVYLVFSIYYVLHVINSPTNKKKHWREKGMKMVFHEQSFTIQNVHEKEREMCSVEMLIVQTNYDIDV